LKAVDLSLHDWKTFQLPLRSGGTRRGVVIWFRFPHGLIFPGEASPLPGWSQETTDAVVKFLQRPGPLAPPSFVLAREMAWAAGTNWQGYPPPAPSVPLAALLAGPPSSWHQEATRAVDAGARTLKIKIQPDSLARVPGFLRLLKDEFPPGLRIRLDANRSLATTDFLRATENWAAESIEFIEEPIREYQQLAQIIARTHLPLALDETLREISPSALSDYPGAAALVFKPTLMGGWEACAPFAEVGRAMGSRIVISACFESGLGTFHLCQLALRYAAETAAGLDTYSMLETDLLISRLPLNKFTITPFSRPPIDESRLD